MKPFYYLYNLTIKNNITLIGYLSYNCIIISMNSNYIICILQIQIQYWVGTYYIMYTNHWITCTNYILNIRIIKTNKTIFLF